MSPRCDDSMKSVADQRLCGATMMETELKIWLDEDELARLRRLPALAELRRAAPRDRDAGVGLLRHARPRAGRRGRFAAAAPGGAALGADDQAPERRTRRRAGSSRSSRPSSRRPADGWCWSGPDPDGALAAVREAAGDAPLAPVFETRVRRVVERLAAPGGGEVELALDEGEIVAGEARAPIREARARAGGGRGRRALRAGAAALPDRSGPLRARPTRPRAATGCCGRARRTRRAEPRSAGAPSFGPEATVETAARDVLRDCLGQIAANMAVVADSAAIEGPHQLRVGLRRLRTAFAVFGPSLGKAAMAPLAATARRLGRVVGELRDADVLMSEVVAGAARLGLDLAARGGARRGAGGAPRPGARRGARGAGGAGGDGLSLRPRRLHRGTWLAGRVRLFPERAACGADRRGRRPASSPAATGRR